MRDVPDDLPEVTVPECPGRGHTRARPRFAIDGLTAQVVVCPACGLGRLHPMPSEAEVEALRTGATVCITARVPASR